MPRKSLNLLPRQALAELFSRNIDFCVYGGAAGGAKTFALNAIPCLDSRGVREYRGITLRRTLAQARKAGSLWDTLQETGRKVGGTPRHSLPPFLRLPRNGKIEIGHLNNPDSIEDYMSAQYNFVGVDEATQVRCQDIIKLKSRIRDARDTDTYSRMILACNPDRLSYLFHWVRPFVDPSHALYPYRYGAPVWFQLTDTVTGECEHSPEPQSDWYSLTLIPSKVEDNPYLANTGYASDLDKLPPHLRARYRDGSWLTSAVRGDIFRTEHLKTARHAIPPYMDNRWQADVRAWDTAASWKKVKDSDYCAGGRMLWDGEELCVTDMVRVRPDPGQLKRLIVDTAKRDGPGVRIAIEREPGSQSGGFIEEVRAELPGFVVQGHSPTRDKIVRSEPLSLLVYDQKVTLLDRPWNAALIAEMDAFGTLDQQQGKVHDDQVDALNLGLLECVGGSIYDGNTRWVF